MCLIYFILTESYSILIGYLGLFSLSQVAFFGLGAYISALLSLNMGTQFLTNLVVSSIITMFIAFLLGSQLLKLTRHSFAIATLAFMFVVQLITLNWMEVTRGPMGLPHVPRPNIIGIDILSKISYYYLYLAIALVTFVFLYLVVNSRVGRAFISIREDEALANSVGVNCFKYKMIGFLISAFFASVAGTLYVHYTTYISPDIFDLYFVIVTIIIVVIGGGDSLEGVGIAAFAFTAIPEFLRSAQMLRETVYGVLLIVLLIMPESIKKKIKSLWYKKPKGE